MSEANGVEDVLRVATERARALVGAHQAVSSLTVDESWAQAITTVSLSDRYGRYRGYDTPADGSGIYALVCEENRPYRLTHAELEAHPAWRAFGAHAEEHPPMRGWLAVPLIARDGRNLGLIQLSDKYAGEFDEDDEAVLVQLALLASAEIENARLLDETQEALTALARSEERMRTLVSATSEIVWTTDTTGAFLERSVSWERYTGQRPEDYLPPGRGWMDAVHPDDRLALTTAWQTVMPRGERVDVELRLRRHDGEWRRATASAVPVHDADGTVREWVGSTSDVEDVRRTEEAYRAQTGLTRTITENAASALFLMDADGRPTYMNAAAEAMTGWRLEEIGDRTLHETVHHSRPDGSPFPIEECPIGQALDRRQHVERMEEVFIRRDGTLFPVRVAASPLVRDGAPVGTVVEVQDISEEHRAREQVQKFAALVESSEDFIGMADLAGGGMYLNPAGCALVGLDPSELERVRLEDFVPGDVAERLRRRVIPRTLREGSVRGEWMLRHFGTAEQIPVEGSVLLIRDPVSDHPLAIATVLRDIRERRRREEERTALLAAERDARRLAELLARTAASLAAARTAPRVAAATIEGLEAAGVGRTGVHLLHGERIEAYADAGEGRVAARRPHPVEEETPAAEAIRTRAPVEVTSAAEIEARFPRVARARRADGIESLLAVPLAAADGHVLGALVVGDHTPGRFPPEVRRMVAGVAEQCGLALERALLQAQAEAAAADASLLSALGDALERATTAAERCRRLVNGLADRTALAAVHLADADGALHLSAIAGRPRHLTTSEGLTAHVAQAIAAAASACACSSARSRARPHCSATPATIR
ncbi:MAG TPA: PAS domain S-box protein, partial [Miltoncostaeaceae bacterium]|nr:PAS domain S-box protein [Miltoncostaeaceae bacterium]